MEVSVLLPLLLSAFAAAPEQITPAGPSAGTPAKSFHQITNGQVTLTFGRDASHGLALQEVGDAAKPLAYRLEAADLWTVDFYDPVLDTKLLDVGPSDCNFLFSLQTSGSSFTAIWSRVNHAALPQGETFRVTVTGTAAANDPLVDLRIDVDASRTSQAVYGVSFPRVQYQEIGESADQVLTYPYIGGWLLPDPMHNSLLTSGSAMNSSIQHPGFLSMQWFSHYDASKPDSPVLFLQTRDVDGYRKEFRSHPVDHATGPDALRLEVRHVPEDNLSASTDTYASPFGFGIGVLRGDWYDAARYYRSWATRQHWTAQGNMVTNGDFSPFIKDGEMFAVSGPNSCCPGTPGVDDCACTTDHDTFQYWARDNADLKNYFGITEMPTHLYQWERDAFDGNWGDWLPAWSQYVNEVPNVTAQGDVFAPYFLNIRHSTSAPGYDPSYVPGHTTESVEDWAIYEEDGSLNQATSDWCTKLLGCGVLGTQSTITSTGIDLATDFAYDFTEYITEAAAGHGADGIYLDVFSNTDSYLSYSPNPAVNHPHGGGKWAQEGKLSLVTRLRDHMRNTLGMPDFFVYSESNNEMLLGVLELTYAHATGLTSDSLLGAPIMRVAPLFETVYHDFHVTGTVAGVKSPSSNPLVSDPDSLRVLRQFYTAAIFLGRAPWSGSIFSSEDLATLLAAHHDYELFLSMIQSYMGVLKQSQVRDFVTFGERVRDPLSTSTQVTLATPGLLPYDTSQPLCYVSAWHRPDLDASGVLLLNWTDDEDSAPLGVVAGDQTFGYTVDAADLGLSPAVYTLTEVTETGTVNLGPLDLATPQTLQVTVRERSARFFIIR